MKRVGEMRERRERNLLFINMKERRMRERECSCEREGGRLRGEDNVNKRRRTMRPGSGHVLETALSTFVLF